VLLPAHDSDASRPLETLETIQFEKVLDQYAAAHSGAYAVLPGTFPLFDYRR
jgi:hypothetical protein